MLTLALLALQAFLVLAGPSSHSLPPSWKTCRRSDPNMNTCLQTAMGEAVLSLKDGMPSLGVLPVDPLHLDFLSLGEQNDPRRPVNIQLDFMDLNVYGISSLKMGPVKVNWDKNEIEGYVEFKQPFRLIGNYTIKGKVLILPIVGEGPCKLTFDNFAVKLTLKLRQYTKKKEKYIEAIKFGVEVFTTRLHYHFENLFKGDKRLGDQMNTFINENWSDILEELKPSISRSFGEAFRQIANRIFSRVPFEKLAPP